MTVESNVRHFFNQWQLSSSIDYHINDFRSRSSPTAVATICSDWDIILRYGQHRQWQTVHEMLMGEE
jgi:hypothetical protein